MPLLLLRVDCVLAGGNLMRYNAQGPVFHFGTSNRLWIADGIRFIEQWWEVALRRNSRGPRSSSARFAKRTRFVGVTVVNRSFAG